MTNAKGARSWYETLPMIDLRSDTVTKPTAAMRRAMVEADVGDDVYGEDPTVRALEERVARDFGMEAALFVSSGTMGNQLAIACHTRPGDEVIVGEGAHPVFYECAAGAALSGVQFAVAGTGGLFLAKDIGPAVRPDAYYFPRTRLVCVENTHNRAGGRVFRKTDLDGIVREARARSLALHVDGARIWNAHIATKTPLADLVRGFDTVSVCFSKGLGAPVGSALVGPRDLIRQAHRLRKMWGGGMRQVGVLAAAALHALDHHLERVADDHANAAAFASALTERGVDVAGPVETNIVNVDVTTNADRIVAVARAQGLLVSATSPTRIRAVTHLDVDRKAALDAAEILAEAASGAR